MMINKKNSLKILKNAKNKNGFTMTHFMISIIILIITAIIILGFLGKFDWFGESEKQVCHNSVIYKATVPNIAKNTADIPLNCDTEKICITTKFLRGDCDEDYLGEKYSSVRISGDINELEKKINKIIAEKLYTCWWMMGQGKVNVWPRSILRTKKQCVPCARIAFAKDVKEKFKKNDKKNGKVYGLFNYLSKHKVENSDKTYWQYLTNGPNNIKDYSHEKDFFNVNKQKIILFTETDKENLKGLITGIGAVSGGLLVGVVSGGSGVTLGAGIGFYGGSGVGEILDKWFTNGEEYLYSWFFGDYDFKTLKNIKCTSFK